MTIATGFVVDDAIVVLENITRHIEAGMPRFQAAIQGAKEVTFTVLSMSLSLIAVFTPILLMGGIVGRLFHEFAVTLSVAILVSLVVSLTTTPDVMRALAGAGRRSMHTPKNQSFLQGIYDFSEGVFLRTQRAYDLALMGALRHTRLVMLVLAGNFCP